MCIFQALPPPIVVTETAFEFATEVRTVTHTEHHTETLPTRTVTVPEPANTRHVHSPAPSLISSSATSFIPRTTAVEVIVEEVQEHSAIIEEEVEEPARTVKVRGGRRPPKRWWGGW